MPPRDWDAQTYDRVSTPMEALGREVLERLALQGDESVLDAGCGSGRVTAALVERLPRGRVLACDGSPSMVAEAQARLGEEVECFVADLTELTLGEPVDAILSTATFHWIADHDALFAALRGVLKPGGRLVAQCGGEGNIAAAKAVMDEVGGAPPYAEHVGGFSPWNFQSVAATEERLRAAGFAVERVWLEPRPVAPPEPCNYFATIMLGSHLERLPEPLRDDFTAAVVAGMGPEPIVDYVRLNIDAVAS